MEKEKKKKKKKGRIPCCQKDGVRRGAWTPEEDKILVDFISQNGHGTWRNLPKLAGLLRCGKSCRLRWTNYLRPDIKRGPFTPEEENTIIRLHNTHGNKWASIASNLPGRTDNDIKNFFNSHLRKRFGSSVDPTLQPSSSSNKSLNLQSNTASNLEAESRLSTKGDYFIQLWNSEVGESFRNINENVIVSESSPSSSLTKVEPPCKITSSIEEKADDEKVFNCKMEVEDFEFDDSSDAMLKLLLDFPVGDNDMGF
ncbi:hypothetical protein RD792_013834, partial [Penstemon davidsonii]